MSDTSYVQATFSTRARFMSSTAGRQAFPNIMQDAYGHKCMTGFHRYGRALGAVIPLEGVLMLAGYGHLVPPEMQERILIAAQLLLDKQDIEGLR